MSTITKDQLMLNPVGVIHSSLKTLDDCPLQGNEGAPEATIEVYPPFTDGLDGMEVGNELIILTWFHESDRSVVKCYPRKQIDAPHVGVFTTRSPERPNPIGLHRVKITGVGKDGSLKVKPLEALDGTPVIDIKPVIQDNI
jgi:tRNA-Thr(GGU) m(6)t(6)A37 methyltransferase TsaA